MSLENPNLESSEFKREEVVSLLKEFGTEDQRSKEAMGSLIEIRQVEIEKILDKKEHIVACFNLSIEIAEMYYEAGLLMDALEGLTETGEAAWDRGEMEICDRIKVLMDEIEAKL